MIQAITKTRNIEKRRDNLLIETKKAELIERVKWLICFKGQRKENSS